MTQPPALRKPGAQEKHLPEPLQVCCQPDTAPQRPADNGSPERARCPQKAGPTVLSDPATLGPAPSGWLSQSVSHSRGSHLESQAAFLCVSSASSGLECSAAFPKSRPSHLEGREGHCFCRMSSFPLADIPRDTTQECTFGRNSAQATPPSSSSRPLQGLGLVGPSRARPLSASPVAPAQHAHREGTMRPDGQ